MVVMTTSNHISSFGHIQVQTREAPWNLVGLPCGYLFRSYTSLHTFDYLYYVLNKQDRILYEFESETAANETSNPRGSYRLEHARLDATTMGNITGPNGVSLFNFRLYCRAEDETPAKLLVLCATSQDHLTKWIEQLRGVFLNRYRSDEKSQNIVGNSINGDAENGNSNGKSSENRTWKQKIMIEGKCYLIPCSDVSTNALLLSESIRAYMRENPHVKVPEFDALYNVTQKHMLDLSDDVLTASVEDDVFQAVLSTESIVSTPVTTSISTLPVSPKESSMRRTLSVKESTVPRALSHVGDILDPISFENSFLSATSEFLGDIEAQKHRILKQLRMLCYALDKCSPSMPSVGWVNQVIANDVRIYKNKSSHQVLSSLMLPCSVSDVLDVMLSVNQEHFGFRANGRFLESGELADVVVFSGSSMGTPLFRRNFCVSRFWQTLSDGSQILVTVPSRHPCSPKTFAEGEFCGVFLLRPLINGNTDARDHCMVHAMFNIDLRVPLLSNRFNTRAMIQFASSLTVLKVLCACKDR